MMTRAMLLSASLLITTAVGGEAQERACGFSIGDWCPAPASDPCGRHRNVTACRADPTCYGMPYRGESMVACMLDARGFASNCPTVGCTSTPPPRPGAR